MLVFMYFDKVIFVGRVEEMMIFIRQEFMKEWKDKVGLINVSL